MSTDTTARVEYTARRSLALALALVLPSVVASPDPGARWSRVFPDLPSVRLLWYDAPATYWVASWEPDSGAALLRTTGSGATWETIAQGPAGAYAVTHTDPPVIYKHADGFHVSHDQGKTWLRVEFVPFDPAFGDTVRRFALAVSPDHARRLAYATGGWGGTVTVRDMDTNEHANSLGTGGTWTHPDSGACTTQRACRRRGPSRE